MRAQLKHRNFRLRVGFGKQADALHVVGGGRRAGNVDADGHGVAVVHQAAIVNSTRPACTGAPPVKALMAMRNVSGMAWACSNRCQITRPVPPCSVLCSQRRRFAFMRSFQRLQIGDHVFDLLRVQEGSIAPRCTHALSLLRGGIGQGTKAGHQAVRVQLVRVGHRQPQLRHCEAAASAVQRWPQIGLETFFDDRRAVMQQAQALLPVGDDGAATLRVAWGGGCKRGHAVGWCGWACWTWRVCCKRAARPHHRQRRSQNQPSCFHCAHTAKPIMPIIPITSSALQALRSQLQVAYAFADGCKDRLQR